MISLMSPLPTLHQFVTNPVSEVLNSTQTSVKVLFTGLCDMCIQCSV